MASLALEVAATFGISLDRLHYDPTHILFTGAYAGAAADDDVSDNIKLNDNALRPAPITKGRAVDDAPKGTRMVHAGLAMFIGELGPLPICGHTIDGNQNSRTRIRQQLVLIRKLLKPPKFTMISDRGTFSVSQLLRLAQKWGAQLPGLMVAVAAVSAGAKRRPVSSPRQQTHSPV